MDMRSNDRGWLKLKLDALARTRDEQPLQMPFPPAGEIRWTPGIVAGFAEIVRHRCEELGMFEALDAQPTPMLDAMMFRKGPSPGRWARCPGPPTSATPRPATTSCLA